MVNKIPHGTYVLALQGQMVVCDYAGSFNLAGVEALIRDVLALTQHLPRWVLFQRPEPSAAVTFDAIEPMMNGYLAFQQAGCLAVAIVERSFFVHAGKPYRPAALTLEIRIKPDEDELLLWLQDQLHVK